VTVSAKATAHPPSLYPRKVLEALTTADIPYFLLFYATKVRVPLRPKANEHTVLVGFLEVLTRSIHNFNGHYHYIGRDETWAASWRSADANNGRGAKPTLTNPLLMPSAKFSAFTRADIPQPRQSVCTATLREGVTHPG